MRAGLLSRRLFWRVYLTLLVSLIVVSLAIGILWRVVQEREGRGPIAFESRVINALLPPPGADPAELQRALARLAEAVGGEVSLLGPGGVVVASAGVAPSRPAPRLTVPLGRGRALEARARPPEAPPRPGLVFLVAVAIGVGLAALPIVSALTRRLEALREGVEAWGDGDLARRVTVAGRDEVAAVARSFNAAADRVQDLLGAHKALLAHASHELRSPLARLRLAVELLGDAPSPTAKAAIESDIAELDQLVDEILLASRLDRTGEETLDDVDLVALAAEEAARTGATLVEGPADVTLRGSSKLLRRLIRNLLENARKHGGPPVEIAITANPVTIVVADRGPGIAEVDRERVFEPFFRPRDRAESSGGWGLGLALVRQIARRHGGTAVVMARDGGGARFEIRFKAERLAAA